MRPSNARCMLSGTSRDALLRNKTMKLNNRSVFVPYGGAWRVPRPGYPPWVEIQAELYVRPKS